MLDSESKRLRTHMLALSADAISVFCRLGAGQKDVEIIGAWGYTQDTIDQAISEIHTVFGCALAEDPVKQRKCIVELYELCSRSGVLGPLALERNTTVYPLRWGRAHRPVVCHDVDINSMSFKTSLAHVLRARAKESGKPLSQIQDEIDRSQAFIFNLGRGRALMTEELLDKLSESLGTDSAQLILEICEYQDVRE